MIVATKPRAKTWTVDSVVFRSPLEARFFKAWRSAHPSTLIVPQLRIVRAEGKPRVDFGIVAVGIAVEIDGAAWHNNPDDAEKDRLRDLALNAAGWQVVRVSGAEMRSVSKAVGRVWAEVEASRSVDREIGAHS